MVVAGSRSSRALRRPSARGHLSREKGTVRRQWPGRARLTGLAGLLALAAGVLQGIPVASAATTPTVLSLTFDNDTISEYTLGYQQTLHPHGVKSTFYLNSGTRSRASTMSWPHLSTPAPTPTHVSG